MRVAGIDVCRGSVVVCCLEERPCDPRSFHLSYSFHTFAANADGIRELLALSIQVAVLEPTGVHYARIWIRILARNGVEIRLVGHDKLKAYRKHLDLPFKNDKADSLALACYFFDYSEQAERFIRIRIPKVERIRELILQLNSINRVQSPAINRLRQGLEHEFPEIAKITSIRREGDVEDCSPPLFAWLAQREVTKRTTNKYNKMKQDSIGLGVSDFTRVYASILCDLSNLESQIERELEDLLSRPIFSTYLQVFDKFGFGLRIRSQLICQVYPFEGFLENGRPIVRFTPGRNGKLTKKHLSLRRFKSALGMAPMDQSSGKSKKTIVGGSGDSRKALWLWVHHLVEPAKNRVRNEITQELGILCDKFKAGGMKPNLARSKVAAEAVNRLFKELVLAFSGQSI